MPEQEALDLLAWAQKQTFTANMPKHMAPSPQRTGVTSGGPDQASRPDEACIAQKEHDEVMGLKSRNHMEGFMGGVRDSVNTPYIPTGFPALDKLLGGGFFEGLYILGGISSLGKTSLTLQMADQIASTGHDVLYFSLEMSRYELMAQSISRLTFLGCDGDTRNAKTARCITTGSRHLNYSQAERALIESSVGIYNDEYSSHIFITEGIGDIGVSDVRKWIGKFTRVTGSRPVIIIDYLQVLAPHNDRATEKQNTDKSTLELKRISRDYKLPIVAVSSFNRANYNTPVAMGAFKESGAIEYSSDVLIGLQLRGVGATGFDVDQTKAKSPREIELLNLPMAKARGF